MTTQVDLRTQIAERLKIARQRAGYDSAELFCKQYALDWFSYQLQEEGILIISAAELINYTEILQVSVSYLLLGEELMS